MQQNRLDRRILKDVQHAVGRGQAGLVPDLYGVIKLGPKDVLQARHSGRPCQVRLMKQPDDLFRGCGHL